MLAASPRWRPSSRCRRDRSARWRSTAGASTQRSPPGIKTGTRKRKMRIVKYFYLSSQIWQAPPPPPVPAHRVPGRHRAALLRAPGGQDAHRDAHQGHDPLRGILPVAVIGLASGSSGLSCGSLPDVKQRQTQEEEKILSHHAEKS